MRFRQSAFLFNIKWIGIMFSFLFFGCSSNEEQHMIIDEDFCSQIHFDEPHPLSEQLEPYSEKMLSKTGVYTLEEGDVSMIARAWLCESAEKTIDIQYFIFSADNVGLIAIDYLIRAADRGVQVRILIDDIMVQADAGALMVLDAHPNIFIKIYNPTSNIGKNLPQKLFSLTTDFQGFNQRMHNKTFIVDKKAVITGGRNIADEYFDFDHEYNFRDRDVLLIGRTALDVSKSFERFWESSLSTDVSELVDPHELKVNIESQYEYVRQYSCNPINFWPQIRERIRNVPVAIQKIEETGKLVWVDSLVFVSDSPGKNDGDKGLQGGGICTDYLINLIANAKKSIYIQSPYLITTELGQDLFRKAVERGVEVKILTNSLSSTDNVEAFSGYERDREVLLNIGIRVFEFKPDAAIRLELMTSAFQKKMDYAPIFGLHAKSMVIDEDIAVIGTFNLDPRSANLNTECVAVIYDDKIAGDLLTSIKTDLKPENAWETTLSFNPDGEAGTLKRIRLWFDAIMPKSIL